MNNNPARPPCSATVKPATPALRVAALEALGEGVCVAERRSRGARLRVVPVNPALCAMTGYTPAEVLGRPQCSLHIAAAERDRLNRWLRATRPRGMISGEGHLARKDGSTVLTAWTYSPVSDAEGAVTHVVSTYRDITEKSGREESLGRVQRLEAMGRFAGGVAHDFNNLISVINGYCEMLAGRLEGMPEAMHELQEIRNAGQKAAALTRQLLVLGRRQPMEPRHLNLNQLIRENVPILSRLIGDAGRLELDLTENLGAVRIDPGQFQQVLFNLVFNARDALRSNGRITLGTARREIKTGPDSDAPPGRYVALTVADNGTGMDTETQRHMFEPFFTTKPEGEGSGLGLALVYGVVQQSGGFIAAKSELLVGTTFEILLPELPAEPEPMASPAATGIPPIPVTRGHETVLLVEPDIVLRKMVAGILTADGYRVTDAASAAEAQAKTRGRKPPVQLLITNLDDAGRRLVQTLRKSAPDLRVLDICNQGARHEAIKALPAARQQALPKPFALSQLLRAARQLLDA